jgi:flagellar protein FliO/FliZ
MTQSLLWVAGFVVLLALLPVGIKWVQARAGSSTTVLGAGSKVLSAVAVGPQQRVVTVEVGPNDARICLVLGVTQQSIVCLHSFAAVAARPLAGVPVAAMPPIFGNPTP